MVLAVRAANVFDNVLVKEIPPHYPYSAKRFTPYLISITRFKPPAFSRSALAALFLAMFDVLTKYAKQGFQRGERSGWTFSPLRPARTHLLSVGGCSVAVSTDNHPRRQGDSVSREMQNSANPNDQKCASTVCRCSSHTSTISG